MKILTGNKLKEYVDHHLKTIPDSRFFLDKVIGYLHSHTIKICGILGLRSTEKTVLMMQAMKELQDWDRTFYIVCSEDDSCDSVCDAMDTCRQGNFFIEEITIMPDFIKNSYLFSDMFSSGGAKIVIAGTDANILFAKKDALYGRIELLGAQKADIKHKCFTENAKMPKNIVLVRHGESESNAGLPTFDHEKIPLTEKGMAQAGRVARYVPFVPELTISSPFSRARSTASQTLLRFPCTKFEVWPEVREFTYLSPATCAGTTSTERKPRVDAYWNAADPDYVDGEGAESFRQFMERVDATLQKLGELTVRNIVVFSHAQFIRALLLEQQDPDFRDADYSGKMRMFLRGRRIANAEMVLLGGIGLKK